jgi:ATP-dependent helicase/nuclease subunit B
MRQDLAQRIEAGCVVVTPNRRLAAHLKRGYDAAQLACGKAAWASADCVPLNAFLERIYAELARYSPGERLLSAEQELALWEQVVAGSPQGEALLNLPAAARAAREAWGLQHAHRIDLAGNRAALDDDGRAYFGWAARVERLTRERGFLDGARLPDAIARLLGSDTAVDARSLVLYGFDEPAPQLRELLHVLAVRGWKIAELAPAPRAGRAARSVYPDAGAELTAVAEQVRAALSADPGALIGVVVPDLAVRRADVARIFDDVLEPSRILAAARERARPYNVSLGRALSDCPLVHTALLTLSAARGEAALDDVGSLLRSPFIMAAEQEFARRAVLDAELRSDGCAVVELRALARRAPGRHARDPAASPQLAARLGSWVKLAADARRAKQPPSQWSITFQRLLSGLGWPGERALDSEEYQSFVKWRELVSGLSAFDVLTPRIGYEEALSRLKRLAAETLFQSESPEVPVQVLGVLEANALQFDRLFVTGLTDEAWPPPARPNPFLPIALQRARRVPHASSEWQLEYARRTMKSWLEAAAEIRLSWPRSEGERELNASPMLAAIAEAPPARFAAPLLRDAIYAVRAIERVADFSAPGLPAGVEVPGGARFFENQAACPFKGCAVHRLGAQGLEAARAGLDARERGGLAHIAVFHLWRELKSHARLAAMSHGELASAVERAVTAAVESARRRRPDVLTEGFAALERERMRGLLLRLAEIEKGRPPFEVLAREDPRLVTVGGVKVSTRLDRLDRLAGGRQAVLDYKTARAVDVAGWFGERPDEPQLPLYAASSGAALAAVAFVQLHAQQVRFEGVARDPDVLPGVPAFGESKAAKHYPGWDAMLESWRGTLEALAGEYLAGRADVAPKKYPQTCERCDLGTLCRVNEIMEHASAEEDADE